MTTLRLGIAALLAAAIFTTLPAAAGPEKVAFPVGYQTDFVIFERIDRDDRKIVRFMYVNRDALQAAKAGQPGATQGTVLVMEDHKVRLNGEEPVRDANGRLVPTDELGIVFVMEKQAGWGSEYGEALRNGEWEYAMFRANGERIDRPTTGCLECHKGQEAVDYTFTYSGFLFSR